MRSRMWLALALAVGTAVASSGVVQAAITFDPSEMMRVSEVREGMTGYLLTTMKGATPEKFGVEVLGVAEGYFYTGSVIIFRMTEGPLVEKKIGILGGMSGSPVYIDGKLLGAVSLGFGMGMIEPLGGVTPIEQMLEAARPGYVTPGATQSAWLRKPINLDGHLYDRIQVGERGAPIRWAGGSTLVGRPVATPLYVSGMRPDRFEELAKRLEPLGFRPVLGPGQISKSDVETPMVPGAPIGVAMSMGATTMAGVGTITYVKGNELLAFGHPMAGLGLTDMPMVSAWVHTIVASNWDAFKQASPVRIVGSVTSDQIWAVYGVLGRNPPLVDFAAHIINRTSGRDVTLKSQFAHNDYFLPMLAMYGGQDAISATVPDGSPQTGTGDVTVKAAGLPPVVRHNLYAYDPSGGGAGGYFGGYGGPLGFQIPYVVEDIISMLHTNPYERPRIESIQLDLTVDEKYEGSVIDKVSTDKVAFRPGETVDVKLELRKVGEPARVLTLPVELPKVMPDGTVTIIIGNSDIMNSYILQSGLLMPYYDTLPGLVERYNGLGAADKLATVLTFEQIGAMVPGGQIRNVTGKMAEVFGRSGRFDVVPALQWAKKEFPQEELLEGVGFVEVFVENERGLGGGGPAGEKEGGGKQGAGQAPPEPPSGQEQGQRLRALYDRFREVIARPGPPRWGQWLVTAASENQRTFRNGPPSGAVLQKAPRAEAKYVYVPASAKDGNEEAGAGEEGEGEKEERGSVGRQALRGGWTRPADFAEFEFQGTLLSPEGPVRLSNSVQLAAQLGETIAWSVAVGPSGEVYVGTGHGGKVLRVDGGDVRVALETGELEAESLAVDGQGNLYVGTAPGGKIFRLTPDGKSSVLYDSPADHVWALVVAEDGGLYAGTGGDEAVVYRIAQDGTAQEFFRPKGARHITCLAPTEETDLYVGTGEGGGIFQVSPDGTAWLLYDMGLDMGQGEITTLLPYRGDILAATTDRTLLRVKPSGAVQVVGDENGGWSELITVLLRWAGGVLVATAEETGTVGTISQEDTPNVLIRTLGTQFVAGTVDENGTAYMCTANPACLYSLPVIGAAQGNTVSPSFDAGVTANWGFVAWRADVPEETSVVIQSRTGNRPVPDPSWSGWSEPYWVGLGEPITSPAGRFIQFRATLVANGESESPSLHSISFLYLPANQRPTLTINDPSEQKAVKGDLEISWDASDPDDDHLVYRIMKSADFGETWDQVEQLEEDTSYTWDTTSEGDGQYLLKVVASDEFSNPTDPLSIERVTPLIIVDNTKPAFRAHKKKPDVNKDGTVTFSAAASDATSGVAAVDYRVDEEDWIGAVAVDGMFDSRFERFTFTTKALDSGKHKIEVHVFDAAGNSNTLELEADVPEHEEAGAEQGTGAKG